MHNDAGCVTLLDVDGNEMLRTFEAQKLYVDRLNPDLARPQLLPDAGDRPRLFVNSPSGAFEEFGNEPSREWIHFPYDQQRDAVVDIWSRASTSSAPAPSR